MAYWMTVFGVSLGLTLAIELPVAYVWGLRGRQLWMAALVNLMTNPLAVALHMAAGIPQLPIELAVVLAEALAYARAVQTQKPIALSLVSNGVSWGLGLVIQMI